MHVLSNIIDRGGAYDPHSSHKVQMFWLLGSKTANSLFSMTHFIFVFFQVNENDRLWGDDEDSTLPSPGLSDRGAEPSHLSLLLGLAWLLLLTLLLSNQ